MTLNDYVDKCVAITRLAFPNYPTVDRFVAQFNPTEDDNLTYKAPAILLSFVSASRHIEREAPYDLDVLFGAVIVRDELDKFERDKFGLQDVEKLANVLDRFSGIASQANVPFLDSITKTDRRSPQGNSGYSYWTATWTVAWRIDRPFLGEV